jgi:protein-tyrosine phosphatase
MEILFVCTGNTCRSCMVEAIFNSICTKENIACHSVSAGVSIVPFSKISSNALKVIRQKIDEKYSNKNAIQLDIKQIKNSDIVLTMTENIKKILKYNFPSSKKKIYTLNEYVGIDSDVPDPFGGDYNLYVKTFEKLMESVLILIERLKGDVYI